jgi:hypothetical protein
VHKPSWREPDEQDESRHPAQHLTAHLHAPTKN